MKVHRAGNWNMRDPKIKNEVGGGDEKKECVVFGIVQKGRAFGNQRFIENEYRHQKFCAIPAFPCRG